MKMLRDLLVLIRIQSTPLTVVPIVMGYATVGSVFEPEVALLALMASLGHWGFYSLNDVMDKGHDAAHGKVEKPLVGGDLLLPEALVISLVLIISSIAYGWVILPTYALVSYLVSMGFALAYNYTSKSSTVSSAMLGAWGYFIVLSGAYYAGSPNRHTALLAASMAAVMVWLTILGELKDLDHNEPCIPRALGCEYRKGLRQYSGRFSFFMTVYITALVSLFLYMSLSGNMIANVLLYMLGILTIASGIRASTPSEDSETAEIVVNTVFIAAMFIFSSMNFLTIGGAVSLFGFTAIWGLGWQQVLFGDPLHFP